jgi:hypothetical protein
MSGTTRQPDETGTFRQITRDGRQLIQAIEESLQKLHQLAEVAVVPQGEQQHLQTNDLDVVLAGVGGLGERFVVEVKRPLEARPSAGIEILVMKAEGQERAITRTSQRDDRFDLDLSVFLPDLDEYEATLFKRVFTKLSSFMAIARQENAEHRITQLLQAIAPHDPLADVQLKVAEATVALRTEFLDEVPVLTSAEVHANAGFPRGNASQTVHRWRKGGKIFAINHGGRDLYPAFQFGQDGRPLPTITELLKILRRDPERTDWDNALWFAGESGWLDGKAPKDCLQSDPQAVKRAAEQEVLVDEY